MWAARDSANLYTNEPAVILTTKSVPITPLSCSDGRAERQPGLRMVRHGHVTLRTRTNELKVSG